jgi:hypothetical protein
MTKALRKGVKAREKTENSCEIGDEMKVNPQLSAVKIHCCQVYNVDFTLFYMNFA